MKQATKAAPALNLFAAGTKVKETGAKKTEKKLFKAPELKGKIKSYQNLKAAIEANTAELKMIDGDIKGMGKDMFLAQYREQKSTPDNFIIQDETGATCQFVVMDKYTIVDGTKAAMLENFDGLLETKTEYKVNAELVTKYGQLLSDFIMNSSELPTHAKGDGMGFKGQRSN